MHVTLTGCGVPRFNIVSGCVHEGAWASQVGRMIKNPPANAGDIRDSGSIPGSERFPGGGHGNPLRYFCLENPMDRETWWPTVLGHTESDMTGRLSMHAHLCLEITLALFPQHLLPLLHFGVHLCTDIYIFWSVLFLEESNRMGKTRSL